MSKLSSLSMFLILAGSSVAAASPTVTYTPAPAPVAKPIAGDGWRGDGHHLPDRMPQHKSWDLLGSARMTGRSATLDVSSNERYQKLELRASRFSSLNINRVMITFAGGETQLVRLPNQGLYAGKPIVIDLEGRRGKKIDKVTVVGRAAYRGSFSVLAI